MVRTPHVGAVSADAAEGRLTHVERPELSWIADYGSLAQKELTSALSRVPKQSDLSSLALNGGRIAQGGEKHSSQLVRARTSGTVSLRK